jgi:hypothetical protein
MSNSWLNLIILVRGPAEEGHDLSTLPRWSSKSYTVKGEETKFHQKYSSRIASFRFHGWQPDLHLSYLAQSSEKQ